MPTIQTAYDTFLLNCQARNLRPATLNVYRLQIGAFVAFCGNVGRFDLADIDTNLLRTYFVQQQARGLKPATVRSHARCLRAWLNFCASESFVSRSPFQHIRLPKEDHHKPDALTRDEVQRMIDAAQTQRNRTVIYCLLDTGCRLSEFAALRVGDVDLASGAILLRRETKNRADRTVFLGQRARAELAAYLAETPGLVKPTERGYHDYRYEGGVDLNAEPLPDGDYRIIAEARDLAGNAVRVERALRIEEGGKPRADVAGGEIDWQGEMNRVVFVPLGDKLCFQTVVANESAVPIHTTGPWPGAEYKFTENSNTLAAREDESWFQQAGVWRFGVNFDTTGIDFPFRWAVGRKEDLERRVIDGEEQWYLMPGKRGLVHGCIVIDEKPPVGTRLWWGGLIHEFVEVANNNIDRITVEVGAP
jgi:hypothetical protein